MACTQRDTDALEKISRLVIEYREEKRFLDIIQIIRDAAQLMCFESAVDRDNAINHVATILIHEKAMR